MQNVDLNFGLAALHTRLIADARSYRKTPTPLNHATLTATASALTLMLFGPDSLWPVESAVRAAAWGSTSSLPPDATDEDVRDAFLARLPEDVEGTPVRARFFADAYRDLPQTA